MSDEKEVDRLSGVETTGHDWDGIKELNNPAPRWWLWVFFLTCIWGVGYWVVYPAWPTLSGEGARGGTAGSLGWTQYQQLEKKQAAIHARKANYLERFQDASFDAISQDAELYAFAVAGGQSAFKDNCATCHGTGGAGAKGYPNLNDDDWLWGGSVDSIYLTIKYGIRAQHEDTRISEMPAFGAVLSDAEIDSLAAYIVNLANAQAQEGESATLFADNCAACHGAGGRGVQEFGGPNLVDQIWFYSDGDVGSIASQIRNPKHGVMPHWEGRLDDDTIHQLSIYVHSLGGGE
ncbi:MAG: cytochrome-c oxidase, cbb3-type subunit III [Pseudomonadota bacterium]